MSLKTTLLIIAAASGFLCHAPAQDAQFEWKFSAVSVRDGAVQPLRGPYSVRLSPQAQFRRGPDALVFDERLTRDHGVIVDDISDGGPLPAETLTVESWVQIERPLTWGGICGCLQDNGNFERGWLLGYCDDRFCLAVASEKTKRLTYLKAADSFSPGYWYHVVGTYDGRTMRLYIDGRLVASSTEQQGPILYAPHARFVVGRYLDDDEFHAMTGQLAHVAVYDECLDSSRIRQTYERQSAEYPGSRPVQPQVDGWPTYLRDNQRTGLSAEEVAFPLTLLWHWKSPHPPRPAWPPPARNDFWNRKYNLKPRVVFDRAFHTVSDGASVYLATSSDCRVVCLDAATGSERWSYYCGGPVRLAPSLFNGAVLFGADDGCVYSVSCKDGSLNWKYRFEEIPERWIAGNERIISSMPVRSGVLVEDGIAYFCVGLFPSQGVYQVAVDAATGRKLAAARIHVSAQGYLERKGDRLYVPAARDPAGEFVAGLKRRGKPVPREIQLAGTEYRYSFIGAQGVRFGGGDGVVAAFDESSGQRLWMADVDGVAWGLSFCHGRLFVSTSTGSVYAFGEESLRPKLPPPDQRFSPPADSLPEREDALAALVKRITATLPRKKGYCLVTECMDSVLLQLLAEQTELQIVAIASRADLAKRIRRQLAHRGLYGRVTVQHRAPGQALPFTDYLFNLVISDSAVRGGKLADTGVREIKRVLTPGAGVAFLSSDLNHMVVRDGLSDIGEWTHMYANPSNTSCSGDPRVHGEMQLQWFGEPGPRDMVNRHHRTVAPLFKNGLLFIPGYDRVFVSDAYNGTLLWSKTVPNSRRMAVFRDCSYMACGDTYLFVAAADRCLAMLPQNGRLAREFQVPAHTDGKPREWGYVATVGNRLFGSVVKPGASRREQTRESIVEGSYFDNRDLVCSDAVFAWDVEAPQPSWVYQAVSGAILNSTLTILDERLCFVESGNPDTLLSPNGRNTPAELLSHGAFFVALDRNTGKKVWRVPALVDNVQHNLYALGDAGKLVLCGSRNTGNDKETDRVAYEIRVFDASSGQLTWRTTQKQDTRIGGDHGEQDLHPVIVNEQLYIEPHAYELHTGKPVKDWGWRLSKRKGCGNISASADALFFREKNPAMFDLNARQLTHISTTTRPGCLINIIPAGGLLLIPEASSGCTCNFGVQTSLAFLPVDFLKPVP